MYVEFVSCFLDNRDHRPCCEREGISGRCLDLCNIRTGDEIDAERFLVCISYKNTLSKCFNIGKGMSLTAWFCHCLKTLKFCDSCDVSIFVAVIIVIMVCIQKKNTLISVLVRSLHSKAIYFLFNFICITTSEWLTAYQDLSQLCWLRCFCHLGLERNQSTQR